MIVATSRSGIDLAVPAPRTPRDHDIPPESNRLEPRVWVCHPAPHVRCAAVAGGGRAPASNGRRCEPRTSTGRGDRLRRPSTPGKEASMMIPTWRRATDQEASA